MITVLVAVLFTLGASSLAMVVFARFAAKKLAAGASDVLFFGAVASASERERTRLEMTIGALERQRAIDLDILNGLSEGVLAVDGARRIVLANRRFAELDRKSVV